MNHLAFNLAWKIAKESVVCNTCGDAVHESSITASSETHGPTKPRWEACHKCVSSGKVVDNDGNEVS